MADHERNDRVVKDVDERKETVSRQEKPSMVGATFIKYAAYIAILLIILYFLITYVFPMFQ